MVRIVAKDSEIDKIKNKLALSEAGLEVRQFEKLNPRLVIRGIPADFDRGSFMRSLVNQNLSSGDERDIRIVYWFPVGARSTTSVVIEVPPGIREGLLLQGRVYIGWSACGVADHVRVTQCYKCLSVGHIARNCRAGEDTCDHCGEHHESRACLRKGTLRCHNCVTAGLPVVDHAALDTRKCPMLQRRIAEKTRQIRR